MKLSSFIAANSALSDLFNGSSSIIKTEYITDKNAIKSFNPKNVFRPNYNESNFKIFYISSWSNIVCTNESYYNS